MAASLDAPSFQFPAPRLAWEQQQPGYATQESVSRTAHHLGAPAAAAPQGYDFAAVAAPPPQHPPVFFTAGQLTLSSSPSKSDGINSNHSTPCSSGSDAAYRGPPGLTPYQQHQRQRMADGARVAVYTQQVEQINAELLEQCQEMQERLEASAATHQTPPSPSITNTQLTPDGDLEAEGQLQRRLAAKQREAEAAAAALAAAQQLVQAREGELAAERGRAAALADELAHCKEDVLQRNREVKLLAQRLEAATSHAGLLDNAATALHKQGGDLGKALAQRDVAIRGLEDRLRALQGSEGSKDKQLEGLHSEREALQRDNAALHQHAQALAAEVRRLEAALSEAKGQVMALRSRSRELEVVAASAAAVVVAQSSSGTTPPSSTSRGGQLVNSAEHEMQLHQGGGWCSSSSERYVTPGTAASFPCEGSVAADRWSYGEAPFRGTTGVYTSDSRSSTHREEQQQHADPLQQLRCSMPARQQLQAQQYGLQPAAVVTSNSAEVRASCPDGVLRGVFQQYNQPTATPTAPGSLRHASADGDTCSLAIHATGPPSCSPTLWQQHEQPHTTGAIIAQYQPPRNSAGPAGSTRPQHRAIDADEALSGRMGSVGLGTPGATSPFGTEDTLQDMLERTAALEGRLLALNAERNELEAESARMPAHTAGRTLQERKRRAEVERRLEAIGRECSSVRLQLRRLGASGPRAK